MAALPLHTVETVEVNLADASQVGFIWIYVRNQSLQHALALVTEDAVIGHDPDNKCAPQACINYS